MTARLSVWGWPTEWPEFVRFYCDQPRASLRDVFRTCCAARPAGDKFAWRKTDRPAGSTPAMRWANPPVAWMMHAGIGRMLAAGLAFPAHRHDPCGGGKVALVISPTWRRRLVADGSGDLLDAVICGLQAAHAAALPRYGLPRRCDPLEGWIAGVPGATPWLSKPPSAG